MATLYELFTNPAVLGLCGAVVGAIGGFIGARSSKPHEMQTAVNNTVHEAIDGFKVQLSDARVEAHKSQETVVLLTERVALQSETIERLTDHIRDLNYQIEHLRSSLRMQCGGDECPLFPKQGSFLNGSDDDPRLL